MSSNTDPSAIFSVNDQNIAIISLNRPRQKNAISVALLRELSGHISTVSSTPSIRALIVASSEPGSFCAGADLAERRTMSQPEVNDFLNNLGETFSRLEALPVPTIAAIDGPALGGGLELALSCDFRVAGSSVTKIGLPETKLGIIPGAGGTQRLPRLLGITKAKHLVFTGRSLTATEAEQWGLVEFVAPEGTTAVDRAVSFAEEMISSAPLALRAAKQAINRSDQVPIHDVGLAFERACYAPLLRSKDRDEALEAFKEKRKPVFTGQ